MKNAPKRGKSARRGNMPSPYTKYNKKEYYYDMALIERNRIKARAAGMHYVDYMRTQRDKPSDNGNLREAA